MGEPLLFSVGIRNRGGALQKTKPSTLSARLSLYPGLVMLRLGSATVIIYIANESVGY